MEQQQSRGGRTQWIAWCGAALGVLANVIGVAQFVTASRFVLSLATGALAVAIGGFWLWRLFERREPGRTARLLFAVNLAMVVLGAGVLGGAFVSRSTGAAAVDNNGNNSNPYTAPERRGPGAGSIMFSYPLFGNTFADGQNANGTVGDMPAGSEIWLLVRPQDGNVIIPQGPCTTNGATWYCFNVRLAGGPKRYYVLTAVVAGPEAVARLNDGRELREVPPGVHASEEIVVQG